MLDDAIKAAAKDPSRLDSESCRRQLFETYALSGSAGARTVLDRCLRLMKDSEHELPQKLVAVRLLDMLMDQQNNSLAKALSKELKLLTGIARRSKESDRRRRRPSSMFTPQTSDAEVAQFVTAMGELLDKWGRRYENETAGAHPHMNPELTLWVGARRELLADSVKLPTPEVYKHLGVNSPTGSTPGDLDERRLARYAEELEAAIAQHGPQAEETAEALSGFESELALWQRAAQGAVERDDFVEFERLSEVTIRFAELGQNLESSASASRSASTSVPPSAATSPPASVSPPPQRRNTMESEASGGRGRRRHREKVGKAEEGPGGGEDWWNGANTGGPRDNNFGFGDFGGGEAPAAPVPVDFGGGGFAQSAGCGGGGHSFEQAGPALWEQPAGRQQAVARAAAPDFWDQPSGDPGSFGRGGGEPFGPSRGEYAPAGMPSEHEAALERSCAELQVELGNLQAHNQQLQAQNHNLQVQLEEARVLGLGADSGGDPVVEQQLHIALRRLRELEPLQAELADSRVAFSSLREANSQLQQDLDQCRRELRQTRKQVGAAEDRVAEREDLISQTRRRLFEANRRSAQLEEEIQNQSHVHTTLQGRLQSARAQQTASEVELRQVRHALGSLSTPRMPIPETACRGNVGYGREARTSELVISNIEKNASSLSVLESDELAASTLPNEGLGGGGNYSPVRRLAAGRRDVSEHYGRDFQSGGIGNALANEQLERTLPRSSSELWQRTAQVARPRGALLSQTPPAARECIERTNANFRNLLLKARGLLYEDQRVALEMSLGPVALGPGRPGFAFEIAVVNCGGHPIHEVRLGAKESAQASSLLIEAEARGGVAGVLWQQQRLRFHGRLEVYGPFEIGPQVELSYRLQDDLGFRACLRLPLAITRFMVPIRLAPSRVLELWASPDFAHAEVAIVCTVRNGLMGASAPFSVWKSLELGGVFCCLPGLDENPRGVVLASSYPQRQGTQCEVLVRAELGGPGHSGGMRYGGGKPLPLAEASACRVAIRSSSHLVNRALAQVILDVLCDPPEPAAVA